MGPRKGTTGYAGVLRRGDSFVAYVWVAGRTRRAGTYATAVEAAVARDRLVRDLGLSAVLNFEVEPEGVEPVPLTKGPRRGSTRPSDAEDDEAGVRRMVAKGDEAHGAALKAEVRRIAAERHRDEVRQIAVRVVTAAARKVERDIIAPACSELLQGMAEINATLATENRRLDAAISAEALRQRGDKPLN